ncbi:hypothetical protein KEM52_000727 [Ascosphaera acerosa]|nr:hypothetical protein KEM52_000727 [Ascosphaera acerosa]
MATIQRPSGGNPPQQMLPNVLPCRVHHDGPVDISKRFWRPETTDGNGDEATVHFRGRRLMGRKVVLPEGYEGVVATRVARVADGERDERDEQYDANAQLSQAEQEFEQADALRVEGTFSELMLWNHEGLAKSDDPYVKGVEEWVAFAERVSSLRRMRSLKRRETATDSVEQIHGGGAGKVVDESGANIETLSIKGSN